MSQFVHDPGDISALQADFASGASDPVVLVENLLRRADEVEPHVQAWLSLDRDNALRQAHACREEMRRGVRRGPLHGIPVAVKDVIDIAGQRTRAGSRSREQCNPAIMNADIVTILRAAGAVILGKTHTTEYAYFDGPPPTRNPWRITHTPGGSSSGSAAAVAAGMVTCSIGTQTAGSVVRPAAYCGIAAFKPSTQDLSTHGIVPLAPAFDTVGWFGYRLCDAVAVSLGLQPQRFKKTRLDRALRVAVVSDRLFSDASDAVIASVEEAKSRLRTAGHDVVVTKSPTELFECLDWHQTVLEHELSRIHGALETTHSEQVSAAWLAAIIRGKKIEDADYVSARYQLLQAQAEFWDAWANVDVLIAPAAPDTAPEGQQTGDPRYIIPFTALGGPIATLPIGLAPSGLPLGLMLCGKPGSDAALLTDALQLAKAIEMPRLQNASGLSSRPSEQKIR
jgi:aspartyl-tRNA(Asn)/glutamyl-tRNA(Gln) amidotransferase subunit A